MTVSADHQSRFHELAAVSAARWTAPGLDDARSQMGDEVAEMFAWFERAGFDVDIEKLRSTYPEVQWQTFEEWAGAQDWSRVEPGP